VQHVPRYHVVNAWIRASNGFSAYTINYNSLYPVFILHLPEYRQTVVSFLCQRTELDPPSAPWKPIRDARQLNDNSLGHMRCYQSPTVRGNLNWSSSAGTSKVTYEKESEFWLIVLIQDGFEVICALSVDESSFFDSLRLRGHITVDVLWCSLAETFSVMLTSYLQKWDKVSQFIPP